ncbi:hypothetical protein HZB96_01020 [Candidatus Gottesmanbacteria bacterium]|nr:hypothetical protein [Candidatus Gottesmanbacteria bacterium]
MDSEQNLSAIINLGTPQAKEPQIRIPPPHPEWAGLTEAMVKSNATKDERIVSQNRQAIQNWVRRITPLIEEKLLENIITTSGVEWLDTPEVQA